MSVDQVWFESPVFQKIQGVVDRAREISEALKLGEDPDHWSQVHVLEYC
jgi:hypothetical protein